MQKSRGTAVVPLAVARSDLGFNLAAQGYDGVGAYRNMARIEARVRAATPGAADMEGEWIFYTTPPASITAVETMRLSAAEGVVANSFKTFGGIIAADGTAQSTCSVGAQGKGVFLLTAASEANGYYAVTLLIRHGAHTLVSLAAGGGVSWSMSGDAVLLTSLTGYNTTWGVTRLG